MVYNNGRGGAKHIHCKIILSRVKYLMGIRGIGSDCFDRSNQANFGYMALILNQSPNTGHRDGYTLNIL